MNFRSARNGRYLLKGASLIVAPTGMERTWRSIRSGSVGADWAAVGNDFDRSMKRKVAQFIG